MSKIQLAPGSELVGSVVAYVSKPEIRIRFALGRGESRGRTSSMSAPDHRAAESIPKPANEPLPEHSITNGPRSFFTFGASASSVRSKGVVTRPFTAIFHGAFGSGMAG